MRKMRKDDTTIEVQRHIMTQNMWEFYLDAPEDDSAAFGLVMGFETELGYVSMSEIRPHIISESQGKVLDEEVAPAPGWHWVDND